MFRLKSATSQCFQQRTGMTSPVFASLHVRGGMTTLLCSNQSLLQLYYSHASMHKHIAVSECEQLMAWPVPASVLVLWPV